MKTTILDRTGRQIAQYCSDDVIIVNKMDEIDRSQMVSNHTDKNGHVSITGMRMRPEELRVLLVIFKPPTVNREAALRLARENRKRQPYSIAFCLFSNNQ